MNLSPLYSELENNTRELEAKFLDKYLPAKPEDTPDIYRLEVSAFCVLLHSSLEHYFENLARKCTEFAVSQWIHNKGKTNCLISFCINFCSKIEFKSEEFPLSVDRYINEQILSSKAKFLKDLEQNNGATQKYLSKILAPIGLEINSEVKLESSLEKIGEFRGDFAHKVEKLKIPPPEDAKKLSSDCLLYCLELSLFATDAIKFDK